MIDNSIFSKMLSIDYPKTLNLFQDPLQRMTIHAAFVKLAAIYEDKQNADNFKNDLELAVKSHIENKTREGKDEDYFESFENILNESSDNFVKKYKQQMASRILYRIEKDNLNMNDDQIMNFLKINQEDMKKAQVLLESYKNKYQ
jgi:hypothetical protein